MNLLKDKNSSIALSLVSLGLASVVNAGTMGPVSSPFYFGLFGGAGGLNSENSSQVGTAFFPPVAGGPLFVNAVGKVSADTVWAGGGFIGYKWGAWNKGTWLIDPAVELEGYYFGLTQTGNDLDSNTSPFEHDFRVKYPMDNGVLLANGVLHFDSAGWGAVHPYVGGGIGAAVLSISGADSTQLNPPEAENHFNSGTNATDWAFAAQVKAGLSYNITPQVGLFAEYRFLYVSSTDYTFGSTQYPSHVATTPWAVGLDSMYYNLGTIGIRYDV